MLSKKSKKPQDKVSPSPVFLIAAPRTGSTLLYQLLLKKFQLGYVSNFTNKFFPRRPYLGGLIQRIVISASIRGPQIYPSRYGKIKGAFAPSEGSNILKVFFGGEHPSQIKSCAPINGKEADLVDTFSMLEKVLGKRLLIKNAWNCFRVASLSNLFPTSSFIWLKRDIVAAANSDLEARVVTKGSPRVWNSATPANYRELLRQPFWEQVVENQYQFNAAVDNGLKAVPAARWSSVWYEDLMLNPDETLSSIGSQLRLTPRNYHRDADGNGVSALHLMSLEGKYLSKIEKYVSENPSTYGQQKYNG